MDPRLVEAAITGNINYLQQLLKDNPFIFSTVGLMSAENPLHIAAATGNADFVKEIIRLKPELVIEPNDDGFTPMHVASMHGHEDVVREMVSFDSSLCLLQGRDKSTPLHLAAIKGKVGVINAILFACCECIGALTDRGETALQLAVRNSRFEAVKVMVDWIRENNKLEILSLKDEKSNTVLHLATWKRQRQVIELLLGDVTPGTSLLEVNAVNHSGITALDLLTIFPSEAGDCEIMEILRGVGAKRGRDISNSNMNKSAGTQTSIDTSASSNSRQSPSKEFVEYFKFKQGRDSPSEARSTLLLVASLVTTTTFQFGINPPGGVWQDTYQPNKDDQTSSGTYTSAHNAGQAIWASNNVVAFLLFMFFNSLGNYISLYMIGTLTSRFPLQLELTMCLIAMYSTYNIVLVNITPVGFSRTYMSLITGILPIVTPWLYKMIWQNLLKLWKLVVKASGRDA